MWPINVATIFAWIAFTAAFSITAGPFVYALGIARKGHPGHAFLFLLTVGLPAVLVVGSLILWVTGVIRFSN